MNRIMVPVRTIRLHPFKTLQSCTQWFVEDELLLSILLEQNRGQKEWAFRLESRQRKIIWQYQRWSLIHSFVSVFALLTIMKACSSGAYF